MKILAKLLIGFIAVALLCGVVGVVGMGQISNLDNSLMEVSDVSIPIIDSLNVIDSGLTNLKAVIRTLANPLGIDDDVFYQRQLANVETYREEYKNARTKYEASRMSAEEQRLYDAVTPYYDKATAYVDLFLAKAAKARTATMDERSAIFQELFAMISGDQRLVFDDLLTNLRKVITYDDKYYGIELPMRAKAAADIGSTVLLVVTILAFGVAILLGTLLGTSISRSLKKSVAVLDKISQGDLSEHLQVKSNDEFKLVAASLDRVIINITALAADAGMLAQAAVNGKLATRADASKHQGDYRKIVEGVNKTLDAVIGPLNVAANYVDRISKGDLPPKITDSYNGDFNEIKNNLNQAIGNINALVVDAGMLGQAAVDGKLATRADASKHQGDYRKIVEGVNKTLDAVIGPLNVAANYVDRISKGDLPPKITDSYNGDFNEIKNNLNQAIGNINALVVDAATLAQAAVDGKLATRADASKHQGDYRKIVEGVNKTLDAVIGPLNVAANYVDQISKGAIPAKITDTYNGDFNTIKSNLNQAIDAVNALVADANMLSKAAVEGKLATRADATKHQGDFRKIVQGVDDCLDAVIGPLNVAANYVDRISKGDLPPKITDSYNGDFNEIKNNLNQAIGNINALVADAATLAQAAVDGKLATRADASKHQGDYRKIVEGVNKTLDAVIGPLNVAANYVDQISKGAIPAKITDTYNGDFNTIKSNLNQAIDAVNALVADANMLSKAAVEGKLATRADATKHQGDFRKIVQGVDDCLDAVIGPLNVAANYVDRISKGDNPPKITDNYNGDFNVIKNNLNACIEAINQQAAAAQGIAAGDFSVEVKIRSENDIVAKSLIGITKVLLSLQTELARLTLASKEGQLDERGKPEQFVGAFAEVIVGVNQMLDAILLPIGEGNRVLRLIRGGNLREKVEIACKGDHEKMKQAINGVHGWLSELIAYVTKLANGDMTATMAKASTDDQIHEYLVLLKQNIQNLVLDAGILEKAAIEGKLATRADATKHQGDYKKIVEGVNKTLDAVIGPLNVAANYVDRISKGDLPPKITDNYNGDFNEIKNNLNQAIGNINALVADAVMLVQAAVDGKLATRADATKHQGDYRKIVEGVNKTLDAVIGPLNVAANYVDQISKGAIPAKITDSYNGDFNTIKNNLNQAIDAVNALVADANMLSKAAVEGKLATRADATKHQGDFRKIVQGVDDCLDAVIGPLNVAATYVDQISKGAIPAKITDSYNGDFNVIKNNLNVCVDSINALVADAGMLVQAAIDGRLATRADAAKHLGDYKKIVDGVNTTLDLVVTPINETIGVLKHLAEGDLTSTMTGDYKGDFDVLKTALNGSLESINELLGQVNTAVDQVNAGSQQVSSASQSLSQGASEQASSLEQITSSITEVAGQTKQNTEIAINVNGLAKTAKDNAEQGNLQMKDLVAAMGDINKSAEEIRKIVKAIDDISFQINLLALNANVEAARAGKYGKGFAVVAEEVRNLAVRSANSVKDTTRMVDEAISNIERGNGLVEVTAKQLIAISDGAGKVATLAEEVATASKESTQGIDQISLGLAQIDQVTQANTASAEETASASEELSSQSQQVKGMLGRFKLRASESKVNNAEVLAMLRTELAKQQGHKALAIAPVKAAGADQARRRGTAPGRVNPADVISLDDDNFGKF